MGQLGFARSSVAARSHDEGCQEIVSSDDPPPRVSLVPSTDLGNRRHGEVERDARCWVRIVICVIAKALVLLESRLAVPGYEGIHLELCAFP